MGFQVSKEWSVEETIRSCAGAVSAFIHLKTDCVGCRLARFCTLEEVSQWYGISLDTLLDRMRDPAALSGPEE
jgi:hypothetical protein